VKIRLSGDDRGAWPLLHWRKTHVGNILSKLQLNHRTQAVVYALKQGLVSLDDVELQTIDSAIDLERAFMLPLRTSLSSKVSACQSC
jgi:hypothetical protein